MADKETEFKMIIGAEADEPSAGKAAKKMKKAVDSSVKGGRIEIPVDISVDIDASKDKLVKAQAAVVKKLKKITAKGFSESGKNVDDLVGKFDTLTKELDKAGIGRQNEIYKEIRRRVEEVKSGNKASKDATKPTKVTKTNSTGSKKRKRKADRNPDFGTEEGQVEAEIKKDAKRKLNQIRSDKNYGLKQAEPKSHPTSGIDPSKTTDHMMRLSEYSSHGSNWANELARTLQEEIAKSAKTLVKWIEPNYKPKQGGGKPTTERQFLTTTVNKVKDELGKSIRQLEAGSEEITLDTLKEQAAVIKVLTKALGKTAEDAEVKITDAIEGVYTSKTETKTFKGTKTTQRKIGGTSAEEGSERGVGPGHERTQKLVAELYKAMGEWDPEVIADKIAKEVALEAGKTYKKYENKKKSTKNQAEEYKSKVKDSDDYKAELEKLNTNVTKSNSEVKAALDKQLTQDKVEGASERVADTIQEQEQKATTDANKEEAANIKEDTTTGFNTNKKADDLIKTVADLNKIDKKDIDDTDKKISDSSKTSMNTDDITEPTTPVTELQNIGEYQPVLDDIRDTLKTIGTHTSSILKKVAIKKKRRVYKKSDNSVDKKEIKPVVKDMVENITEGINLPALIPGETVRDHSLEMPRGITHNELQMRTEDERSRLRQELADKKNAKKAKPETPKKISGHDKLPEYDPKLLPVIIDGESVKDQLSASMDIKKVTPDEKLAKLQSDLLDQQRSLAEALNATKPQPVTPEKILAEETGPTYDPKLLPVVIDKSIKEGFSAITDPVLKGTKKELDDAQDNRDRAKHAEIQKEVEKKQAELAQERNNTKIEPRTPDVIIPDLDPNGEVASFSDKLKNIFSKVTSNSKADFYANMGKNERAAESAKRMGRFGMNQNRDLTDIGARSQFRYSKQLWSGNNKADNNSNLLFKDIKLTKGFGGIDTDKILSELRGAIQDNMFEAQTGGALRNLVGSMTGYVGMPSLEKSRAEVDGLNQVMANIRNKVEDLVNTLQGKQDVLEAMRDSGQAKFDASGNMTYGTPEAQKVFAETEELKDTLKSVMAETAYVDDVVKSCGGNVHKIVQELGFVMPELQSENKILQNINAGLDKNGKVLKFQTRTAEVLNYSFQLMARSIGQMWKNWMAQLNPITQIKKAFGDFASYDMKWQRTMNVIKYNIRRIIRPFMEWLAQQFINIIGLANALVKGLGKAFGKNWDLFDQSAASAEQMREELEQAANVTAGFDELHDIGGESSNPPGDLMGDIYTPQWTSLYDTIENFGKKIGDVLNGIHKLTEGWNFWTWLAVIGGAIIGIKVLKWLIGLFGKGKNPLQSVADGLSFLEKAVGWALLIWAFTEFTKALTDFVDCMKTASWEDIAKSLVMLGGAFAILVAGIAGVGGITALLKATPKDMLGMSALVFAFDGFVKAIVPFIECIKDLGADAWPVLGKALVALVGAFVALIAGVAGIEGVTKGIGLMGNELFGLAAVVGALDLFVVAIVPFIEAINAIEGSKWDTIVPMIGGLVGAFIALAAGVGVISRAFSTMDWKAIGQLYAVAGVFEVFMAVLVPFINAIKDVEFETLVGGTILIAGAFLSLAGSIRILAPALQTLNWSSFFMAVGLMAVMAGMLWVLSMFVNSLKELTSEQIFSGLALLAGGLAAITLAITALALVFSTVVSTGIGAAAMALLALVLAVVALVIASIADLVRALGEAGEGIKLICEGISEIITSVGTVIVNVIGAVAEGISSIVTSIATGIKTVLEPILTFVDSVIGKIVTLASTVVHEIGETIRAIIETVGKVITDIITSIVNAIPKLLQSIINFCHDIGPAIENSVDAIIRSITKLVNFVVSAVEYICNLVIGAINKLSIQVPNGVPGIGGQKIRI